MLNTSVGAGEDRSSGEPGQSTASQSDHAVVPREARDVAPLTRDTTHETSPETSTPKSITGQDAAAARSIPGENTREKSPIPGEVAESSVTVKSDKTDSDTDPGEGHRFMQPDQTVASDRELELEQLIAKGTYAVPIGQIKRRRMKLFFLALLLLLAIGIIFDLLLDLEILTIKDIPHTNFL